MQEKMLILDFGSQYTQLIARRVRELNVYCEIHPWNHLPEDANLFMGVILSGSPYSVHQAEAPQPPFDLFRGKMPLLAVCYGAQSLAHLNKGKVIRSEIREYGRARLSKIEREHPLFKNISEGSQVWMSHGDTISELPEGFRAIASTGEVATAAFEAEGEKTYGIQFHPEVYHSTDGLTLLSNFVYDICKCSGQWTPESFIENTVDSLKEQIGNGRVVIGLSGGVDSTVAAVLLHKAIGTRLFGIFVDNGLLRKNEYGQVLEIYHKLGINVTGVDASDEFLTALRGLDDPELKRKAIGKTFIDVFEREARRISDVEWLAQGTIYPDVIESVSVKGPSSTIKSHHNVGGLPDRMHLKIVEPLRSLFKDEVRRTGRALQIPDDILSRHPFPGPGLAIRIPGEVTAERVRLLQEADFIFIDRLKKHNLYDKVWQAATILLPVRTVGVMGDERSYEHVAALRAVTSTDGMTADWAQLPFDFLAAVSSEIINKVRGINRVVYDISSKPPATIEWE